MFPTVTTGSYDDGLVRLDEQAISLRRYHFPSGTAKVIPLGAIGGYTVEPLGVLMQRFCLWGSADLRRWLPLDVQRPMRSTLVTIDIADTWPQPAFTPVDAETFLAVFEELLFGTTPPPG